MRIWIRDSNDIKQWLFCHEIPPWIQWCTWLCPVHLLGCLNVKEMRFWRRIFCHCEYHYLIVLMVKTFNSFGAFFRGFYLFTTVFYSMHVCKSCLGRRPNVVIIMVKYCVNNIENIISRSDPYPAIKVMMILSGDKVLIVVLLLLLTLIVIWYKIRPYNAK